MSTFGIIRCGCHEAKIFKTNLLHHSILARDTASKPNNVMSEWIRRGRALRGGALSVIEAYIRSFHWAKSEKRGR